MADEESDSLDLDVKKRYIEGLFAIMALILVFVSDKDNEWFYYIFSAFIIFAFIAITFINLKRNTPEARIVWDSIFAIISILIAISFSSVITYLFYIKTLNKTVYSFFYEVIFSSISIYANIVLLDGIYHDFITSYHDLPQNTQWLRTIIQGIKIFLFWGLIFYIFYIIGHYMMGFFISAENATYPQYYLIQNSSVMIDNSTVTITNTTLSKV